MHVPLRRRALLSPLAAVAVATLGALYACGDDTPTDEFGTQPGGPGPGGGGDGGTKLGDGATGGGDGSTTTGPGALQGTLYGLSYRQPIAGRAIKVRDATGKVTDTVSDATGGFSVANVAVPYDVWVAPSGPSGNALATFFLGVKPLKVKLFGDEVDAAPAPKSGSVWLAWTSPGAATSYVAQFVYSCADGTVTTNNLAPRPPSHTLPGATAIRWYGTATTAACDIAILLSSLDGATHYYGHQSANLTNGNTIGSGPGTGITLALTQVPTLGTATLATTTTAPGGWTTPSGSTRILLPAPGGAVDFGSLTLPGTLSVPNIAGATLEFTVSQSYSPGTTYESIEATQVGSAPAAQTYTVPLAEPTPVVSPKAGGSTNVNTGLVEFRTTADARVRRMTWVGVSGGVQILTSETKVNLQRLAGFGTALSVGGGTLIGEDLTVDFDTYVTDPLAKRNFKRASSSYSATFLP